jgi:hypothetical protein
LHESRAISQVDEHEATKIPGAVNPSAQADRLSHILLPQGPTLVRA